LGAKDRNGLYGFNDAGLRNGTDEGLLTMRDASANNMTMRMKIPKSEARSAERLRFHYEVEKELGDRLRYADKSDRTRLYKSVYDELFRRVQDHPQVTAPNRISQKGKVASQVRLIEPFLNPNSAFLEIGGGDCALSFQVAPRVRMAYGLEITDHLIPQPAPPNFQLVLTDGSSIPLPADSVDVAFSFSVVEHIHPEDLIQQLVELHRVLKPGGTYYCVTPNRLLGPHDISCYFDTVATGLHLKEYTVGELAKLYRDAGFNEVWVEKKWKSHRVRVPVPAIRAAEGILGSLPWTARNRLGKSRLFFWALEVCLAGRKQR
jgi:SAM-dependent methyltransferase